MSTTRVTTTSRNHRTNHERGVSLILVLAFSFFLSLLATSLLFLTDVEFRASRNHADSMIAMNDLDNAVTEVVYRLNLKSGASPPPLGSRITVNGLSNYDAKLNPDPWALLTNRLDDDGDLEIDEPDELNFNREWTVRIPLTATYPAASSPWRVADGLPIAGPTWGSKLVEPTIQPSANWREYSTADFTAAEVLTVRFKLDTDTPMGDSEGDGPEIIFHDPPLAFNGVEDPNTLTSLGGDANPANDSPYNLTYVHLGVKYPATGSAVLLVTTQSRVRRGPKIVAQRSLSAEVMYPVRQVMTKAICGCNDVQMGTSGVTNSYKSSLGAYGGANLFTNGDIGSNVNLAAAGAVRGSAEAGGYITGATSVSGNATAGTTVTGTPGGIAFPDTLPPPQPCECTAIDVNAEVAAAAATNNNATAIGNCKGTTINLNGGSTCTLNCGTYYYHSVKTNGGGRITVGDTSCGPVKIYVRDWIDIAGNGIVNANKPADLLIIAAVVDPNQVDLGGTSSFVGVVYAPNAFVRLRGTSDIYGAVLGKNVDGNGGPEVHYDEDLAKLWKTPGTYRSVAWNEVN